jgi:CheY-like chemotaxis protein
MTQSKTILASIKDVYFSSQLDGAAKILGHSVEYLREPGDVSEKVERVHPHLFIVNLADQGVDWAGIIRGAKDMGGGLPVLAFGNHLDLDARERALAAGADAVISNALFSTELPKLIEKYMT